MTATSTQSQFCSVCARQAGLDPAGSAYAYQHVVAAEVLLPWPMSMYTEPGVLPPELLDLRRLLVEAYERGETLAVGALAIAPDPAYSVPGQRRVLSYRRPDGPFADFVQDEYLAPAELLGPLCWALLVDHAALDRFAGYRLPPSGARDLLVCTHGAVDAACAKFGFPIYRQLRRLADDSGGRLRAWRVSHFGGHVFAPTLLDMPGFHYWAYVERAEAELLAVRQGDISRLRGCYRGWGALDSPLLQAAERELLMRHGWAWLAFHKRCCVLAQEEPAPGDEPAWADVRIDYAAPDGGARGSVLARVERTARVEVIHTSGDPETYPYPQYTVAWLRNV